MQRRGLFPVVLASVVALALFGCSNKKGQAAPGKAAPGKAAAGKAASGKAAEAKLRKLTVDQVAAIVAAKDSHTYIFDDNPKESWVAGHVPGAKWLADDAVTASALPKDKAARLIFYCHNEL